MMLNFLNMNILILNIKIFSMVVEGLNKIDYF